MIIVTVTIIVLFVGVAVVIVHEIIYRIEKADEERTGITKKRDVVKFRPSMFMCYAPHY